MNELKQIDEFREVLGSYQLSDSAKQTLSATKLVLLVGPTSSGRNTIIGELVKTGDFHYIVSDTTREKRTKDGVLIEEDGREYWFRPEHDILSDLTRGDFLEAAIIHEQQVSGISIREIEVAHKANQVAVTDIESVGATTIHGLKPDAIFFFVLPPSFDEWMVRMRGRGELPADEMRRRLQSAVKEITLALERDYYWFVVNDTFVQTAQKIEEAVKADVNDSEDQEHGMKIARQLLTDTQAHLADQN